MKTRPKQRGGLALEALKTLGALVVVLGLLALVLRILGLVPPAIAPEPVRTYASVEEARRSTGVPLYLPAYFPVYLQWPPAEVRGWTEPQPKISLTVFQQGTSQPVLWLDEWLYSPGEPPPEVPRAAQVLAKETVSLREGVQADVVAYRERGAQALYWVTWDQGELRVNLRAALPRDEVLRMARSMYPPPSY